MIREPSSRAALRGLARSAAAVLAAAGLVACEDSPTDPMAGLVAAETEYAALLIDWALPEPDAGAGTGSADRGPAAAWRASWTGPDGALVRAPLYPGLAERRLQRVGDAGALADVEMLRRGVRRARALAAEGWPEAVTVGIDRAGTWLERAEAAMRSGDAAVAVEASLRGSDALREVGSEAVARALTAEVEARLRRIGPDAPYPRQDLERIRRLVRRSRAAVEDRDWARAIRRAYYARGLLAGS